MSFDTQRLLELLPAVYRLRDAAIAGQFPNPDPEGRGPLAALLAVLAEQIAALEENLDQLYDDSFVETAAPWAVPYIGDLIGYRTLHGRAPGAGSRRAEVAHTIAFRRRKGTASMLEQLARDVTGWNARAVEFFQLLATTQYMNHVRAGNLVAPDLRDGDALETVGSAFDPVPRTLDVRRIGSRRGRYNVPNIGLFLWRLDACRLERSLAVIDPADAAGRRLRIHPLGIDAPLATRPDREDEIAHLAEPINVPASISRRMLHRHTERYYGPGRSIEVRLDGVAVPFANVVACNLSDDGAGWAHEAPAGRVAIDPVLGRIGIAADLPAPARVEVTHHYQAAGALGGGEYPRLATFASPLGAFVRVPQDHATVQAALAALGGAGIVEIRDNGRYREAISVDVAAQRGIELRAADGRRPTLELTAPMTVRGGAGSAFTLNGIVVAGDVIEVPAAGNALRRMALAHATLVPGRTLAVEGTPVQPGAASLTIAAQDLELDIVRCIVGGVRVVPQSKVACTDSIVDVHDAGARAFAAPGAGLAPGASLTLEACTVIGETHAVRLDASNTILLGRAEVVRRQEGCVRFSYVAPGSIVPRRYRCQPGEGAEASNVPSFTSLRYGVAGYTQLGTRVPRAIARGADDESEMGAWHFLYAAQRVSDLATRLDEYLRVGLEAGVFNET